MAKIKYFEWIVMAPNGLQNVKSFTSFIMEKGAVILHDADTRRILINKRMGN